MNTLRPARPARPPVPQTLALLLSVLLAACAAAGPDYRPPALALPASVRPAADALSPEAPSADAPSPAVPAGSKTGDAVPDAPGAWWQQFRSPALNALIARSLAEHPGVAAGQAAIREAEAFVRAQRGQFAPQIQAAYQGSRQRVAPVLASPLADAGYVFNLHTLQLDLSYTPDVFGANRRALEGLQAGVEQQQALLDATRLSLAGNVAAAAVQEATLRAQSEALREQLALQREQFARSQDLQRVGQLGAADLAVQEAALAALEAQLPPLDRALGQTRDLLRALVGAWPEDVLGARFRLEDLQLPQPLPEALPSSVVLQRPDIRAAEAQFKAANAAVGVAAAARLPTLTLGVNSYGETGNRIADLFTRSGSFWTLAGGITQPLFDGGTLREREAAARAAWEQAEAQYRLTVINAFQNVADALVALHDDGAAVAAAARAEQTARRSLEIGEKQHALGDLGALALAQLRQGWLQARSQRIVAEGGRLADAVALCVALGGAGVAAPAAPAARAQDLERRAEMGGVVPRPDGKPDREH